jgi:RNA polymerase sigma-70 factor (ECF subfamily)
VPSESDWLGVVERLLAEDAEAFLQLARLVNQFLHGWRAYDFGDEWEDLIQEAVTATAVAVRERRIRDAKALPGYVKAVTRNRYANSLKARLRAGREPLPWDDRIASGALDPPGPSPELQRDLATALAGLAEKKRTVVCGVYLEGKTYEQASRDSGIPLGSLKRYLRDGLAELRERLEVHLRDG